MLLWQRVKLLYLTMPCPDTVAVSTDPLCACLSAVGGVMGFALVYGGGKAVIWVAKTKSFPYVSGVVTIVASWFISPLIAGLMSYILYTLLRLFVLRGPGSPRKAIWCLPFLLLITLFVNMFFILFKASRASGSMLFSHDAATDSGCTDFTP